MEGGPPGRDVAELGDGDVLEHREPEPHVAGDREVVAEEVLDPDEHVEAERVVVALGGDEAYAGADEEVGPRLARR